MLVWAPGITSIQYVADLGSTPACVHRATGTIYVSLRIWNELKRKFPKHHKDIKLFILLHEFAHVSLKSTDEKEVDREAFRLYLQFPGKSLKAAVYALTRLLKHNSPEHLERMAAQLHRAINYDKTINKNPAFA